MRKTLLAWSLVILTLAPAACEQVFVRNHPFKGALTRSEGRVWVEFKPFAEALGANLKQSSAGGWSIRTKEGGEEEDVPTGHIKIDGQEIETQDSDGALLVPLDSTALLLGAKAIYNKDLGSIDVSLARAASPGESKGAASVSGPIIKKLNAGSPGAAVDIPSAIVANRINIVEFGAPW